MFKWHKIFSEGWEEVEDNNDSRRLCTSKTYRNVENITGIIQNDRRLSVIMIADTVSIDKETDKFYLKM